MLETPVQERRDRAAETIERHAHMLWIDHGGGGHGYLRGGSWAFSPLPVSRGDTIDSRSRDTTPDELPAAAVCSSSAVTLADLLVQRPTPGLEPESLAELAHLAFACCPISHALGTTVTHTIDVDLFGGM